MIKIELYSVSNIKIFNLKTLNVMETILPYLLNSVFGGGGGWLGSLIKKNGLGLLGNLLSGAVGGNLLPLLTSALGLFQNAGGDGGGLNIASILTSLIGGGAGSLLGGLFKKPAA